MREIDPFERVKLRLLSRREMLRSKWRDFFIMADMEEIAALKAKEVIHEISEEHMPEDAKPVDTMWVYVLKPVHWGM